MAWLALNCDGIDLVVDKLVAEVITIGRVPLNHIVIDNPTVSAQHALLAKVGDSYRLKDLHESVKTPLEPHTLTELREADLLAGSGCRRAVSLNCFSFAEATADR